MPPSGDVGNYYFTQVQHMCAELLRYFDIFKRVHLLEFVTQNESALFDLFNLNDPIFVNKLFDPLGLFKLFSQISSDLDLILIHVSEYRA